MSRRNGHAANGRFRAVLLSFTGGIMAGTPTRREQHAANARAISVPRTCVVSRKPTLLHKHTQKEHTEDSGRRHIVVPNTV